MNTMMKNVRHVAAIGLLAAASAAYADFDVDLDISGRPMRDVRTSTCGPMIGYAGCLAGQDMASSAYWFVTNRLETSRAMRESGAWFQRMWNANRWYSWRGKNPYDPNSTNKWERKKSKEFRQTQPDAMFSFWKDNGIKVLFTLEAWSGAASKREIVEFVDYIVSNKYEGVVAGFELGNETYFADRDLMPALCKTWNEVIPEIKKRMPKVNLGVPICEYFENNPDLAQIRARCLDPEKLKRKGYFSAGAGVQTSAAMVLALSNNWDKITHIIYHAYGAESPYSCSYYGFQRFRNFAAGFEELQGKRWWLSEVRMRSDEDDWCQRIFRESLIMGHYALTSICQPEFDGYNQHEFTSWSGGLYVSNGEQFVRQLRSGTWWPGYRDYRAPEKKPRLVVGSMGVMYRILTEAIKEHPLLWQHGTSLETGTEDTFYTSARLTDEVYARRRALREGRKPFLGLFGGVPEVKGETEWVAATDEKKRQLCLMMVNSKGVEEVVTVRLRGHDFSVPSYQTVSCPDEFVDSAEIPGEDHAWRTLAWEDTQQGGYSVVKMAMYEGLKPACREMKVRIAPHTVQSVTVRLRADPKPKAPAKKK